MDNTTRWCSLDSQLFGRVSMIQERFETVFDKEAVVGDYFLVCSPGRAEILGSHTDYNEGYTLSATITQNLLLLGKKRSDSTVCILSLDQDANPVRFTIGSQKELFDQKSEQRQADAWTNYVKGVVWSMVKNGFPVCGFCAVIQSTIPIGSGVSSSAAIELAVAQLLRDMNHGIHTPEEMVYVAKEAENAYVGAPCGYLDQATIALSNGGWLCMDYRMDLSGGPPFRWETIDMDLAASGYSFVVGYDLESKHVLVDGKYATRQQVCQESIPVFQELLGRNTIRALRDISVQEFEQVKHDLRRRTNERFVSYAAHIIYDNERVLAGKKALAESDLKTFGRLMIQSGASAIYLYGLAEGCPEEIFVYETVLRKKNDWGVLGIRNMGGGFNATTLSLVMTESLEVYQRELQKLYQETYRRPYYFLTFVPAPSVGELDMTAFVSNVTP